jgi:hypothetical protein
MRRLSPIVSTLCLGLAAVAPGAVAETISFEEIEPQNDNRMALSEEYAHLGVHFIASREGAIWDGMSNGDPGGWEIEGTNGPAFVGFNGPSYELVVQFDEPVPAFRVDVASASGAAPGSVFTLHGYMDGELVESNSVLLGDVNVWDTVELTADVDEVVWTSSGASFRPFGADNMGWGLDAAPSRLDVAIDVLAGSPENPLNPGRAGVVPVALMGSEQFDAMEADPDSLLLGVDGAPAESAHMSDIDGDGWTDMVVHFRVERTGTAYGDTSICLTGETFAGMSFAGCDQIRTVPGHGASASSRRSR